MPLSEVTVRSLNELLTDCTVRLQVSTNVGGTGFFVAPGLILTCAHVVEFAWQTQTTIDVYRKDGKKFDSAHIIHLCKTTDADLALLQIKQTDHPCVLLGQEINLNDLIYGYGYPEAYAEGDSITLYYEGLTGSSRSLLKFKAGQAVPGMSGAPLLNTRTGKVCGVLRSTREEMNDLGGRAVPTTAIWQEFPELAVQQKEFHRDSTQWLSLLPSPTSSSLTSQMVRQSLGSSIQLVQLSSVTPASKDRCQRYYEGELISWDILAANADIRRDFYEDLLKRVTPAIEQLNMICLIGEPGAGKSTLAWRLAADVARLQQCPLLHIRDNENSDIWYRLKDFFSQYSIPSVLLVDDIFRNNQVCQALTSLSNDLPVIVIATSRSNEIPTGLRLPFAPYYQSLSSPTSEEKKHVLQKLGFEGTSLETSVAKRLQKANSWLVMMLEVTTGKDLEKIIQDTIARLQKQDEIVYQAYEYLCFAGQYDIGVPETLLDALNGEGHFYKLVERSASNGLLLANKEKKIIRTQHALIARYTFQLYKRNPLIVLRKLMDVLQADQSQHRTFLALLLSQLVLDHQGMLVKQILEEYASTLIKVFEACGAAELNSAWGFLYRLLNDRQHIMEIEQLVLEKVPETTADWQVRLETTIQIGTIEQVAKISNELKDWLARNPQDYQTPFYWGLVKKKQGDYDEARRFFEKSVRINHTNFSCFYAWGNMEKDLGNYDDASRLFDVASGYEPGNINLLYTWGMVEKYLGRLQNAERLLSAAMRHASNDAYSMQIKADIERAQGHYEEARSLFKKATEVDPADAHCWHAWAIMEKDLRNYEEARSLFKKAAEVDPTSAHCWQAWAVMEKDLHNYEEARVLFKKAAEVAPTSAHCWYAWAIMEKDLRSYEEARALFKKAAEVAPTDAHCWHAWAAMEKGLHNYEEARSLFKKAAEVAPTDVYCWYAWAVMEKDLHNYEEARSLFKKATGVAPTDVYCWHSWALMEKGLHNYEEARALFKKATEVAPTSARRWLDWALMEKGLHNYEEARALFKKATEVTPTSARCWYIWALMEKDLSHYREARRLFKKATEVNPADARCWQDWAVMEKDLGHYKESRRLLKKATQSVYVGAHPQ